MMMMAMAMKVIFLCGHEDKSDDSASHIPSLAAAAAAATMNTT